MKFGVARRDITPTMPINLGGYAYRDHASEGIYQELFATALFLSDGTTRQVIIHTDLLYFDETLAQRVEESVERATDLKRNELMLTATHTHCGPAIRQIDAVRHGPLNEVYISWLVEQITDAVAQAKETTFECSVHYGMGHSDIGVNRRMMTPQGMEMHPNPDGVVYKRVHVLTVSGGQNRVRAVVYSYACHPTTMRSYLIGGDYPGFAGRIIEGAYPHAHVLFLQGCGANIKTNNLNEDGGFRSGPLSVVEKFGEEMAEEVLRVIESEMSEVSAPIRAASTVVDLPLANHHTVEEVRAYSDGDDPARRKWAKHLLAQRDSGVSWRNSVPCHIQHLSFGSALTIVALSHEVCVEIGIRIGNMFQERSVIPVAYTNACLSYIPAKAIYDEGGYEVDGNYFHTLLPAPYARDCEDLIVEAVATLLGSGR